MGICARRWRSFPLAARRRGRASGAFSDCFIAGDVLRLRPPPNADFPDRSERDSFVGENSAAPAGKRLAKNVVRPLPLVVDRANLV